MPVVEQQLQLLYHQIHRFCIVLVKCEMIIRNIQLHTKVRIHNSQFIIVSPILLQLGLDPIVQLLNLSLADHFDAFDSFFPRVLNRRLRSLTILISIPLRLTQLTSNIQNFNHQLRKQRTVNNKI